MAAGQNLDPHKHSAWVLQQQRLLWGCTCSWEASRSQVRYSWSRREGFALCSYMGIGAVLLTPSPQHCVWKTLGLAWLLARVGAPGC